MIVNTSNPHSTACLIFIAVCSIFLLTSCSAEEDKNVSAEMAYERSPEQADDAATAIIEHHPVIEEIVVSAPEPEPKAEPEPEPQLRLESSNSFHGLSGSADLSAGFASRSPASSQQPTASMESSSEPNEDTRRFDEYKVELGVDETIKIPGLPGELRVWIGSPQFEADFPAHMTRDEATIPALGESATVEPFAPAFDISPSHTQCIKIHPSGSEVRFKLTPHKQGTFEVGANVYLYDSDDCSGAPIPKTAATLKVQVEVDNKEAFLEKVNVLWHVLWEKFVEFWGALVAIFFGLILFLIRGKLKRWFGYGDS